MVRPELTGGLGAAICAVVLAVLATPAAAVPVAHVNSSADTGPGTLRQAVVDVDDGGTIVFDFAFADPGLSSQIFIDRNVTIAGLGAGVTKISGSGAGRLFEIDTSTDVDFRDLEITGGRAPAGSDAAPNTGDPGGAGGSGGGILNLFASSSITLERVLMHDNTAGKGGLGAEGAGGGGRGGDGGFGGAILSAGPLTIEDSEIYENYAGWGGEGGHSVGSGPGGLGGGGGGGGGIAAGDSLTISNSLIQNNISGHGRMAGGSTSSTSQPGGTGGYGGGIYVFGGEMTLVNVTVTGNSAGHGGVFGGGFYPTPPSAGGNGGGVYTDSPATVINATIAANGANEGVDGEISFGVPNPGDDGEGGGVYGPVTLNNTILDSNTAPDGEHNCGPGALDSDLNLSFPGAGDGCPAGFLRADPLLEPLEANGGPTRTMAITSASPAFDYAPAPGAGCPGTDQRGVSRPQFSACDSGAFEVEDPTPPARTLDPTFTPPAVAAIPLASPKKCKKGRKLKKGKCVKKRKR